jgi:hypothetical protein
MKRAPTKKKVAKKAPAKKKVAKKALPDNFRMDGNIAVPRSTPKPVTPSKIRRGVNKAKGQIGTMVESIVDVVTAEYKVQSVQFSLSFDAEGKVLGIGVGGAATVTVTVVPDE